MHKATRFECTTSRGMKLSEVAESLGKSTGAVAGLLHRGMKALRERLGE